ncbi:MAG: deoxyribonucleoside 5'-monophosphate N-glycosidase, partial [bacterium]|nr:deoxyribonucleoside 5'-monophosphate N-glycosidase [bacterium]
MRKLKIYLGGSIYGGRDFEDGLKLIARVAKELGHDVLTDDFVVNVDLTEKEGTYTGVVERDVTKLNLADVFIAEVSQASHGVGYED